MGAIIASIDALERVIGKTPPAVNLKVIDHIDDTARRWLAAARLMFAGGGDVGRIAITLGGGAAGFAWAVDRHTLAVPLDVLDDPAIAVPGASFGSLFLIPGIGETLRINGCVEAVAEGMVHVAVTECYVHCAKALIRSGFWAAQPVGEVPVDAIEFVAASRFMALATIDAAGHADLSPKGDPAGAMARMIDGQLCFADRPGNRRADSFRNIIAQPQVAAALLIPGSTRIAQVAGCAQLTTDEALRNAFAVQDKVPLLANRIDGLSLTLQSSAALERAKLWPASAAPADIRPAKIFAEHVRLNKDKGIGARIAGAFVSVPGLMQRGLDKDYKDNLY